jgi:protein-tyrosine phosphatase
MRSRFAFIGLAVAALGAFGCDEGPAQSEDFDTASLSKTLTLRFQSTDDGGLSLKSSGKLLACGERFEGLAGERVTCDREGETVEVIIKATGQSVVVVRDLGSKRGYYVCTRKGDVDGAPAEMKCKLTTIAPRGDGGLSSPFDSSVAGLSVPNSHWVDDEATVLRGMEPRTPEEFDQLRALGIQKVVIFKNATGNDDVGKEIAAWGLPAADVFHVPFKWKDLNGFTEPCTQTLDALRFLHKSEAEGKKAFFHCTVGEDRTGYLAALHAVLFDGADPRAAFDEEMCEHGYGAGNPQKPGFVLGKLDAGLTPLYRSMAYLIHEKALTANLETAACGKSPVVPDDCSAR